MPRITPRTLKGFRDLLPSQAIAREHVIDTAVAVYRSYGYAPIDTPALEYAEILTGKGGDESDKQMYRFDDAGGRDVAMRFDLTVPLARYVAQHIGELGTPFKRYHVGPVWRGENTQRGRYREFVQCDFDTIGTESTVADIEMVLVTHDLFSALGFDGFTIKVNDRRVLTGVLNRLELADRSVEVLRALDKLPKIGPERVAAELTTTASASPEQIEGVLALAGLQGDNAAVLAALPAMVGGDPVGDAGIAALSELVRSVDTVGIPEGRVRLDVSIARGLDYYTGIVMETFLTDLPGIGSCCSGGRYDDLASLYTKERLPGVGASLGVDRLLAAMEELGRIDGRSTTAGVLVTRFDDGGADSLALAAVLRRSGIAAEVYPDARRLGNQLKYADRKGHVVAIIAGPDERTNGTVQVKNLASGEAVTVDRGLLVETVSASITTEGETGNLANS